MSFWLPVFSFLCFSPINGGRGEKRRESNSYRNKNEERRKRKKLWAFGRGKIQCSFSWVLLFQDWGRLIVSMQVCAVCLKLLSKARDVTDSRVGVTWHRGGELHLLCAQELTAALCVGSCLHFPSQNGWALLNTGLCVLGEQRANEGEGEKGFVGWSSCAH